MLKHFYDENTRVEIFLLDEFSGGKEMETQKFVDFLLEYKSRPEYTPLHKHCTSKEGEREILLYFKLMQVSCFLLFFFTIL